MGRNVVVLPQQDNGKQWAAINGRSMREFDVAGVNSMILSARDGLRYGMQAYEQLDAFRVCHELALRIYRAAEQIEKRDPELAAQLWSAALIAAGRIARGSGTGNKRMFALCLDRTLGALAEIGHDLKMARIMDLTPEETERELESLRGRAVFYTTKLLTGLWDEPEEERLP